MKKGLKFWSKLLIVSFFLGGMATSAMAQNGTTKAKCAEGDPLAIITRTVAQMDSTDGTVVTLKFNVTANPGLVGDEFYLVTETNGSLTELENCTTMGEGLQFMRANYRDGADATTGLATSPVGTIPENGVVSFNIKAITQGQSRTYHLGVFVKDMAGTDPTSCFSDVYDVQIEVITNIYAMLTLNGDVAKEYICNGATTQTNIGFTLCNLPQSVSTDETMTGRLYYTVKPKHFTTLSGMQIATSGNTTGSAIALTPVGAEINADVQISRAEILASRTTPYVLKIGQQTLLNSSSAAADYVEYEFVEGLSEFYYTYTDANGNYVKLPVKFVTATDYCVGGTAPTGDQLSHTFTVHVAPNFGVQALAFKDATTRDGYTQTPAGTMSNDATLLEPEFCQGTLGYFRAINSTIEGTVAYEWTGTPTLDDDASATPNATIQFTDLTANAYALNVVATWNKDAKFGAGCTAPDEMPITINKAPILLLATDKATSGYDLTWNSTDVITYTASVCPGEIIKIETDADATILATDDANETVGNVDPRYNYMTAGDYVQANGAQIKYTISPNDEDPAVGAYTTWRTIQPAGDGTENLNVAHHLNNGTDASATITYTLENASNAPGACALVKSDGSSLPNGQVKVVYTVSPRPQFTLGAN